VAISLIAPGNQLFSRADAIAMAKLTNVWLTDARARAHESVAGGRGAQGLTSRSAPAGTGERGRADRWGVHA